MSLLDSLTNESIWKDFLEIKENSKNLPQKVIEDYQKFINNKEYMDIAEQIKDEIYEFSLPKKVLIGKMGKSKKRTVYIYQEKENYILKMISFLLYQYDDLFSPNLYSFRKKIGVKKAIRTIIETKNFNKKYAYKVDIKNYFNSIPIVRLLPDLKEDLEDEKLYSLIEKLLLNPNVRFGDDIISEEKGIMAGVPISSFFANYYLKDLDKYFYEKNILYARYADDIIVFGNTKEEVEDYQQKILDFLKEKDLTVNPDKEYFYNPGDKFDFLGFSFENRIIDIGGNSFKKIKGKIRRTARGLRRWMLKKEASPEVTLKAMNRKFNKKFFREK